jgi:precorrin-6x reductase
MLAPRGEQNLLALIGKKDKLRQIARLLKQKVVSLNTTTTSQKRAHSYELGNRILCQNIGNTSLQKEL